MAKQNKKEIKEHFVDGPIANIEGKFEGVLAFNVLYHLDKSNLEKMTEILSSSKRVIAQVKDPKSSRPFILGHRK